MMIVNTVDNDLSWCNFAWQLLIGCEGRANLIGLAVTLQTNSVAHIKVRVVGQRR
jgi:hypothetical protein